VSDAGGIGNLTAEKEKEIRETLDQYRASELGLSWGGPHLFSSPFFKSITYPVKPRDKKSEVLRGV